MAKLTIGRIVHHCTPYGEENPAIVTRVFDNEMDGCDLTVFKSAEVTHHLNCRHSDSPSKHREATWHWPDESHKKE